MLGNGRATDGGGTTTETENIWTFDGRGKRWLGQFGVQQSQALS
jgi:hypothetical protein